MKSWSTVSATVLLAVPLTMVATFMSMGVALDVDVPGHHEDAVPDSYDFDFRTVETR